MAEVATEVTMVSTTPKPYTHSGMAAPPAVEAERLKMSNMSSIPLHNRAFQPVRKMERGGTPALLSPKKREET